MKIYSCPKDLSYPDHDWANYDHDAETKRQEEHLAKLREWLKGAGFNGPDSGKILSVPIADGCAQYLLADGRGREDCLIHLPYNDAYSAPDVKFLPKKEVVRRVRAQERVSALFKPAPKGDAA